MRSDPDRLADQLRRERLLDMELRLSRYRLRAFAVLAIGLLAAGPWLGWWWLIPLAGAAAAFGVADRLLVSSDRPERWMAAAWAISPLMIAVSVALTGAPESPAVPWFALPALTLVTRFEPRGVRLGGAYLLALMLLCTVALEPAAVADDPPLLIFPMALTLAAMILSSAVIQSDREHRRSAVIDPLTGLLNRTALAQRVGELEQQARRGCEGGRIGLLVGDIDHFKLINDRLGHVTGDAVLRDVAYAMRATLRAFDLIYRCGGEEFLILLPGAGREDALEIAERLRRAVAVCSREGARVSMSFGVATHSGPGFDFSRLYSEADAALYGAKESGRDRVQLNAPAPSVAIA